MVFENKTVEEIRTLLIDSFQLSFNHKLRILPKSFIKVIATVLAGIFITLYKQIGWLFLQLFPGTAYWGEVNILGYKIRPLVKWGVLIGVGTPWNGKQWQGIITIDVTKINTQIVEGTQLKSDLTGKIYLVDTTKTLENVNETVSITCNEAGTAGNLQTGDVLNFISPLGNVKKTTEVTTVLNDGTNDETEADYRYRVVNRYRVQPQGGSLSDYRMWASEVPGVLNTYPYNDIDSPSGVILYISGSPGIYPDRIPTETLLLQVGDACTYNPVTGRATRKPMTAVLDPARNGTYTNIRPVSVISFDIYVNGLAGIPAAEFAPVVRPAVEDYFLGREPYNRGLSDDNNKVNVVSKNNVSSTVDQIAISVKAEFDNVVMYREEEIVPTYTLGIGELCKLGKLFINGEEF
jgi:uncharacterized phage protein gp47/JayE